METPGPTRSPARPFSSTVAKAIAKSEESQVSSGPTALLETETSANVGALFEEALGQATSRSPIEPFRFFDNREKYLQFVNTSNEKAKIAERVALASRHVTPSTPALALFDAGMGDATVLTGVLRRLHARLPTVPFLVVGKEIS